MKINGKPWPGMRAYHHPLIQHGRLDDVGAVGSSMTAVITLVILAVVLFSILAALWGSLADAAEDWATAVGNGTAAAAIVRLTPTLLAIGIAVLVIMVAVGLIGQSKKGGL